MIDIDYEVQQAAGTIANAFEAIGAEVIGMGEGYDNGPQSEVAIRLENGTELYILVEELVS